MNIEFVTRGCHLDDGLRAFAEKKLDKVLKFLEEPLEVRLTLEVEKHRHRADLHISHRFGTLLASEATGDLLDSINLVAEKAERQARRSRTKFRDKRRRAERGNGGQWPVEVLERDSVGSGSRPRVIKSSVLLIKPMSIDEAALLLESSKNDFIVFLDAESQNVSVLYKRKDNNYGLISPEL